MGQRPLIFAPVSFMLKLHEPIIERIQAAVGHGMQTFFLLGDRGVGKRTLINRLLMHLAEDSNVINYAKFTVAEARELKYSCQRKAATTRVYIIESDNATIDSFNAILKLLEQPPPNTLFFVVGSYVRLTTVNSRCIHVLVPKLTEQELLDVLLYKGMSGRVARQVLSYSGGSVERALTVYSHLEEKRKLLNHLKAIVEGDFEFVLKQVKLIQQYDIDLLIELTDDILFARYGLIANEYITLSVKPDTLRIIRKALVSSKMPESAWLSAWFQTR